MKKLLFILTLIALFTCPPAFAEMAKVKMKSGAELKGTLISIDPTSCIVLEVAGIETTINMADVESIEKISEDTQVSTSPQKPTNTNPGAHPAVTHKGSIKTDKKGKQYIEVMGDDGQELTMDYVSKEDKTLKVVKPRKGIYYSSRQDYIIPDYVDMSGESFAVIEIEDKDFYCNNTWSSIRSISFPATLKKIGKEAFVSHSLLENIILPDNIEEIGEKAFYYLGYRSKQFGQLFIPESVKTIGSDAFRNVGPNTSYRGFFQGNLTSIPSFITVRNCTQYGLDEEAVEDYYCRNGK